MDVKPDKILWPDTNSIYYVLWPEVRRYLKVLGEKNSSILAVSSVGHERVIMSQPFICR